MSIWQNELQLNIQTLKDLEKKGLNGFNKEVVNKVIERHPMNITNDYFDLINVEDLNDPIRKMSIPSDMELVSDGDYDTSGEQDNTILPGLQHKYEKTALVLSTNQCYMYCRYCFRKRMVGYTENEIMQTMNEAIDYITDHKEIDNVLITGGDSFALSNDVIKEYLNNLTSIDHIDFIRFGTRVPVVYPKRISEDNELLSILRDFSKKKKIYVVTQFNHPKEINEKSIKAINALKKHGIEILNQTVLLHGVNNNLQVLSTLFRKLCTYGVNPYYLFQCRPVKYVKSSFQVPLLEGLQVINEVKQNLNGLSKRFRYVMSHPMGKIEILGQIDDGTIFRFHQWKSNDDANRLFTRNINKEHRWLDKNLDPVV